jgi:DNA-binding XRE family transcriptional regulator
MAAHLDTSYVYLPRLRDWRISRLLSQGELADKAHLTRETISHAEAGRRVSLITAGCIAKALEIKRAALLEPPPEDIDP